MPFHPLLLSSTEEVPETIPASSYANTHNGRRGSRELINAISNQILHRHSSNRSPAANASANTTDRVSEAAAPSQPPTHPPASVSRANTNGNRSASPAPLAPRLQNTNSNRARSGTVGTSSSTLLHSSTRNRTPQPQVGGTTTNSNDGGNLLASLGSRVAHITGAPLRAASVRSPARPGVSVNRSSSTRQSPSTVSASASAAGWTANSEPRAGPTRHPMLASSEEPAPVPTLTQATRGRAANNIVIVTDKHLERQKREREEEEKRKREEAQERKRRRREEEIAKVMQMRAQNVPVLLPVRIEQFYDDNINAAGAATAGEGEEGNSSTVPVPALPRDVFAVGLTEEERAYREQLRRQQFEQQSSSRQAPVALPNYNPNDPANRNGAAVTPTVGVFMSDYIESVWDLRTQQWTQRKMDRLRTLNRSAEESVIYSVRSNNNISAVVGEVIPTEESPAAEGEEDDNIYLYNYEELAAADPLLLTREQLEAKWKYEYRHRGNNSNLESSKREQSIVLYGGGTSYNNLPAYLPHEVSGSTNTSAEYFNPFISLIPPNASRDHGADEQAVNMNASCTSPGASSSRRQSFIANRRVSVTEPPPPNSTRRVASFVRVADRAALLEGSRNSGDGDALSIGNASSVSNRFPALRLNVTDEDITDDYNLQSVTASRRRNTVSINDSLATFANEDEVVSQLNEMSVAGSTIPILSARSSFVRRNTSVPSVSASPSSGNYNPSGADKGAVRSLSTFPATPANYTVVPNNSDNINHNVSITISNDVTPFAFSGATSLSTPGHSSNNYARRNSNRGNWEVGTATSSRRSSHPVSPQTPSNRGTRPSFTQDANTVSTSETEGEGEREGGSAESARKDGIPTTSGNNGKSNISGGRNNRSNGASMPECGYQNQNLADLGSVGTPNYDSDNSSRRNSKTMNSATRLFRYADASTSSTDAANPSAPGSRRSSVSTAAPKEKRGNSFRRSSDSVGFQGIGTPKNGAKDAKTSTPKTFDSSRRASGSTSSTRHNSLDVVKADTSKRGSNLSSGGAGTPSAKRPNSSTAASTSPPKKSAAEGDKKEKTKKKGKKAAEAKASSASAEETKTGDSVEAQNNTNVTTTTMTDEKNSGTVADQKRGSTASNTDSATSEAGQKKKKTVVVTKKKMVKKKKSKSGDANGITKAEEREESGNTFKSKKLRAQTADAAGGAGKNAALTSRPDIEDSRLSSTVSPKDPRVGRSATVCYSPINNSCVNESHITDNNSINTDLNSLLQFVGDDFSSKPAATVEATPNSQSIESGNFLQNRVNLKNVSRSRKVSIAVNEAEENGVSDTQSNGERKITLKNVKYPDGTSALPRTNSSASVHNNDAPPLTNVNSGTQGTSTGESPVAVAAGSPTEVSQGQPRSIQNVLEKYNNSKALRAALRKS